MPLVQIHTNVPVDRAQADAISAETGVLVARELGKPESVMMAILRPDAAITLGGTNEPAALFEIEGIELSAEPTEVLSNQLSDLVEKKLNIPASRTFVKLTNVPRGNWAGNRKVY